MKFRVIDKQTGKEADPYEIALHEEWAQSLVYCDMEGFAITEDGDLMLADECGHVVYCDPERFKVVFEDDQPSGEWIEGIVGYHYCSKCQNYALEDEDDEEALSNFCPNCGVKMKGGDWVDKNWRDKL